MNSKSVQSNVGGGTWLVLWIGSGQSWGQLFSKYDEKATEIFVPVCLKDHYQSWQQRLHNLVTMKDILEYRKTNVENCECDELRLA